MAIDPDGRVLGGITNFLTFVMLNVLYLILCLPIVTIGAATSALFEVTMRYSDDEQGRPVRDFFAALLPNAVRATTIAAATLVPAVALAFSGVFWFAGESVIGLGAAILSFLGAAYLFAAFLFGMALVARFQSPLGTTLRNALLLPAAEPLRTLFVVLLPATAVALCVIFPALTFLLATIGIAFGAYVAAFIFRSAFARYEPPAA
ncbi:YesL family protein [Microbacterium stercoris]|uniref:YesL family protein n=1 Tax=Microbacterium stercoris TaxID=2820289 RepID=A0A939QNI8_9MICO|nr:YesL family protein [Microbacterium stercoris]MBO3664992.1 YesL family protein [Microbacterium stercoris]